MKECSESNEVFFRRELMHFTKASIWLANSDYKHFDYELGIRKRHIKDMNIPTARLHFSTLFDKLALDKIATKPFFAAVGCIHESLMMAQCAANVITARRTEREMKSAFKPSKYPNLVENSRAHKSRNHLHASNQYLTTTA